MRAVASAKPPTPEQARATRDAAIAAQAAEAVRGLSDLLTRPEVEVRAADGAVAVRARIDPHLRPAVIAAFAASGWVVVFEDLASGPVILFAERPLTATRRRTRRTG